MQRTPPVAEFLGWAILAFCVPACSLDDRIHNKGPGVTADLIVYFKPELKRATKQ